MCKLDTYLDSCLPLHWQCKYHFFFYFYIGTLYFTVYEINIKYQILQSQTTWFARLTKVGTYTKIEIYQ